MPYLLMQSARRVAAFFLALVLELAALGFGWGEREGYIHGLPIGFAVSARLEASKVSLAPPGAVWAGISKY